MATLRLLTGEAIVDRMLALAGVRPTHLRRAVRRTVEALDAEKPTRTVCRPTGQVETIAGGPDHDIRLRASEQLYGLVGLRAQRRVADGSDLQRPVAVQIVLAPPADSRARLQPAGGVEIHLGGDAGGGT
jgi:hypothetical protein